MWERSITATALDQLKSDPHIMMRLPTGLELAATKRAGMIADRKKSRDEGGRG